MMKIVTLKAVGKASSLTWRPLLNTRDQYAGNGMDNNDIVL